MQLIDTSIPPSLTLASDFRIRATNKSTRKIFCVVMALTKDIVSLCAKWVRSNK